MSRGTVDDEHSAHRTSACQPSDTPCGAYLVDRASPIVPRRGKGLKKSWVPGAGFGGYQCAPMLQSQFCASYWHCRALQHAASQGCLCAWREALCRLPIRMVRTLLCRLTWSSARPSFCPPRARGSRYTRVCCQVLTQLLCTPTSFEFRWVYFPVTNDQDVRSSAALYLGSVDQFFPHRIRGNTSARHDQPDGSAAVQCFRRKCAVRCNGGASSRHVL